MRSGRVWRVLVRCIKNMFLSQKWEKKSPSSPRFSYGSHRSSQSQPATPIRAVGSRRRQAPPLAHFRTTSPLQLTCEATPHVNESINPRGLYATQPHHSAPLVQEFPTTTSRRSPAAQPIRINKRKRKKEKKPPHSNSGENNQPQPRVLSSRLPLCLRPPGCV
jgi:hypothetical protein